MDDRLRALIEAIPGRIWIADYRPSRDLARTMVGDTGDLAAHIAQHPEAAIALYRASVPLAWNGMAEAAYGLPATHPAEIIAGVPHEVQQQLAGAIVGVIAGEPVGTVEFRARTEGGEVIASRYRWSALDGDDPLALVINISIDQGDLAAAQEAAAGRRTQLHAALVGSGVSVFMFRLDNTVAWVENSQVRPGAELSGLALTQAYGPQVGARLERLVGEVLSADAPGRIELEVAIDGQPHIVDITAHPWRDSGGYLGGVVGVGTDVTERAQMIRDIERAAVTDGLTGLPNRQGLAAMLDAVAPPPDSTAPALVAFDVPDFTAINDVYGHDVGDDCLRAIGRFLQASARDGDHVARIGGDQFALLLAPARAAAAREIATGIVDGISALVVGSEGIAVPLQAVAGVARAGTGRASAAILADVDTALARAKRTRETITVIDDEAREHREVVARRLDWGHRLRLALDADDLLVMAQPIIDLGASTPAAYELLVRLVVDGQVVPAGDFMRDIELLGLTPLLDRWMVRHALQLAARHRHALVGRHLAVNVGATTLAEGHLLDVLDAATAAAGVPASVLAIELTETEAVPDLAATRAVVDGIRARGALFVLDDFGSGTAGAEHLRDLPVDWLKLDGRFVAGAATNSVDRAIVAGGLAVAEALGIPVVAEWIEDQASRNLMSVMGVRYGQGFHLGHPEQADQVLAAA